MTRLRRVADATTHICRRDLGYEPPFTTDKPMQECLAYYFELFEKVSNRATAAGLEPATV